MNVFTVTCDQFNAYFLNKSITFFLFSFFPVLFLALINLNLICNMGCLIMQKKKTYSKYCQDKYGNKYVQLYRPALVPENISTQILTHFWNE